jgi:hypothetical protein
LSDVAKGAQRVGSVLSQLSKLNYRCARVAASGQRKGSRRTEKGIAADVIGYAPENSGLPHVFVEVGGEKKSVTAAIAEMTQEPLPAGHVALVARCMPNRRWRWSIEGGESFKSLADALDAVRAA